MASLDRKDLVKGGKYNRAEIMKRAWAYYKNEKPYYKHYTFGRALHDAWVDAMLVMDDINLQAKNAGADLFPRKGLKVSDLRPFGRANNFIYGW